MRDAQGQSYWQWCRAADFMPVSDAARWDDESHALSLASALAEVPASVPPEDTRAAAALPPIAIDAYGSWARVLRSPVRDRVVAGGVSEPETEIWRPDVDGVRIVDMSATARDWLVILLDSGEVVVRDLLERFEQAVLGEPGFAPDRVAEAGGGTIWLVDRVGKALRRLQGDPLPTRMRKRERAGYVFQPTPLDQDPLRITAPLLADLGAVAEEIIDACGLRGGRLAILGLGAGRASVLSLTDGMALAAPVALDGLQSAFSLRQYGADTLALLVPAAPRAVLVRLADDAASLMGTILSLRHGTGGRLCATLPGAPVAYPTAPRAPVSGGPPRPFARLLAPSRPSYARRASVSTTTMEADGPGAVWHRLYAEAHLPPDCGITLLLAADDDLVALAALPQARMHPHRIGAAGGGDGPRAVWLDQDSERPWMGRAGTQARKRDRCGLWSVLVQKPTGTVKRIAGRYLRVDVVLNGPGLTTPRLYALRVWGARRAWRDRFLPAHLAVEQGDLADGSDFLDRYLALFESVLTPIEDEVAASFRLTRPDSTPTDALDWLAGWIGAELDGALSESAKRRLLAQSVTLWRQRGTLPGLEKVLDIVTEGGVVRGDLVVLEHFHLRRTFATILGADLSDAANPLTPWASSSGNSHLGATFFLGDEDQRAFFALFRPDLLDDPLTTAAERADALADMDAFFDNHAFRVTLLVHAEMDPSRRSLIARVLEREVPAHVIATMVDGPGSLVLALSSLVGVDTRLGRMPPREPLTIGVAEIGQVYLTDLPSLDPRFEGGA